MGFYIVVNAAGPIQLCRELASGTHLGPIKLAVGRAALLVQSDVRGALQSMIYDKPEGGYRRTLTLMRTSHASAPGKDHSGDFAVGSAGADLAATDPASVVGGSLGAGGYSSEIGTWIYYARFVHDGTARMPSRPFLAGPALLARAHLESELAKAVSEIIRTAM